MMYSKSHFSVKKPFAALLAAVMCAGCALGTAAAGKAGVFKNVTNWMGIVTGTRYEQAAAEITVDAVYTDGMLTAKARFERPAEPPCSEIGSLAIGEYQVLDSTGQTVAAGGPTEAVSVGNGGAEIQISCALAGGAYTLHIESFIGESKADAPLPITGGWDCPFTV